MKCIQKLCIYNKKESCILKEIEINSLSMCDSCIMVNIKSEILIKEKEKILKKYKIQNFLNIK